MALWFKIWITMVTNKQDGMFYTCTLKRVIVCNPIPMCTRVNGSVIHPARAECRTARMFIWRANITANGFQPMEIFHSTWMVGFQAEMVSSTMATLRAEQQSLKPWKVYLKERTRFQNKPHIDEDTHVVKT